MANLGDAAAYEGGAGDPVNADAVDHFEDFFWADAADGQSNDLPAPRIAFSEEEAEERLSPVNRKIAVDFLRNLS